MERLILQFTSNDIGSYTSEEYTLPFLYTSKDKAVEDFASIIESYFILAQQTQTTLLEIQSRREPIAKELGKYYKLSKSKQLENMDMLNDLQKQFIELSNEYNNAENIVKIFTFVGRSFSYQDFCYPSYDKNRSIVKTMPDILTVDEFFANANQ